MSLSTAFEDMNDSDGDNNFVCRSSQQPLPGQEAGRVRRLFANCPESEIDVPFIPHPDAPMPIGAFLKKLPQPLQARATNAVMLDNRSFTDKDQLISGLTIMEDQEATAVHINFYFDDSIELIIYLTTEKQQDEFKNKTDSRDKESMGTVPPNHSFLLRVP